MSDAEGQAAATASLDQSSFLHMESLLREDTKGEYVVGRMLGRGGMAVVYLATETQLSRKVALKVLPPELTFGHGVERFKREAKTAAALDHPNIIPIYRIGNSGKIFWYAMKYLEGKSLEDLLRERGAFPLDETIDILEQVADALDYAHDHHVIHRDIKPANVMLDNRNRVIVTDFGIAKALTEGKLTATDSVIGTPYFMSPEQGMGKTVSGASDQYSVGVMAYRMLAGHVPFDGDSAIDILHKHCMFEAPLLHDDMTEIPQHVSDAVARALSKKGDERFASVHDFIQSMKDPAFVPKTVTRPSGATVVMDSSEVRKSRAPATKPSLGSAPASNTGKARTVAAKPVTGNNDKTVVASSNPGASRAKPATASAPAPVAKSRAGLFAGIALVVVAGGGIAAWQMSKGPATTPATENGTAPGLVATPPAPVEPKPDSTAGAGASVPPPVVAAETKPPETSAPATKAPETKPKSPAGSPSTVGSRPPARSPSSAPVTSPVTSPARQEPATTPAPAPVTAAPAATPPAPSAQMGTLQLVLSAPGLVEIDGREIGEKKNYQTSLSDGTHVVVVRKDGFTTLRTTVEIKAGVTTPLRLTLEPRP
ncbi:MAG: protein kinase [Gemmatimonadetes bacterium]|nr:protein kinase [Gemmatimonadota bacterium]